MTKKILIIGASGNLGKILLKFLIKKKLVNITATYNRNKININANNLSIIKFNYKNFINSKIDYSSFDIIFFMPWVSLTDYHSPNHIKESKLQYNFLEFVIKRGIKNLIIPGSCLEYSYTNNSHNENDECIPITHYGKGKLALLNSLTKLQQNYKFNLTWYRLFFLYGFGTTRGVFSSLINASNSTNIDFPMSSGLQIRDFMHIDEVISIIYTLAINNRNNGIVNICSGNKITLLEHINSWIFEYNININLIRNKYPIPDYEPFTFVGNRNKLIKILAENKNEYK